MNHRVSRASFVILLIAVSLLAGCPPKTPTEELGQSITIPELKGPEMERYLGETVTVVGIFVCDPALMLVTDMRLMRDDTPIPDDQYVLLSGDEAEQIDPEFCGAKLRVTGTANAPEDGDKSKTLYLTDIRFKVLYA